MHAPLATSAAYMDLSATPWRRLQLSSSRDVWSLVDADDYDWIMQTGWNYGSHYRTPWKYYAKRNIGAPRSTIYLHREILMRAAPADTSAFYDDHHGDHINGNTLDNTRGNLRWLTPAENRRHRVRREDIPSLDAIVAGLLQGLPAADVGELAEMPF